ncbi:hypothetical protein [Microtetraspora malaysiensis]
MISRQAVQSGMALSRLPDRELRALEGAPGGVLYGPARPYSTGKPF